MEFENLGFSGGKYVCTKGTCSKVLIDTLDRHLDQHSIDISIDTINNLIDTPSTLDQHFTEKSVGSSQIFADTAASVN